MLKKEINVHIHEPRPSQDFFSRVEIHLVIPAAGSWEDRIVAVKRLFTQITSLFLFTHLIHQYE